MCESVAYARQRREKMADGKGESGAGLTNGGTVPPAPSPLEPSRLAETLQELENRLREEEVSVLSSAVYCRRLCEVSGAEGDPEGHVALERARDSTVGSVL